jgi:two-component sensor histidine kinase
MRCVKFWFVFLILLTSFLGRWNAEAYFSTERIDTLLKYNKHEAAEAFIDSALKQLDLSKSKKDSQKSRAALLLRKGIVYDSKFEHGKALPIFLEALQLSAKLGDSYLECQSMIRICFNYEKTYNYDLALRYLTEAKAVCLKNQYNDLYSSILIRYSLLHRFFGDSTATLMPDQRAKMEQMNFYGSIDSAVYYAEQAIKFAKTYNNEHELNESYITLGILHGKSRLNNLAKSSEYFDRTIPYWRRTNLLEYVALMYHNIARNWLDNNQPEKALTYNDSGYQYYVHMSVYYHHCLPKQRAAIFNALKIYDSAYYYANLSIEGQERSYLRSEISTTKRLEEQFQNDKREIQLKSKNRQIVLIFCLLIVIIMATILMFRKNRTINKKNTTISNQIVELSRMLDQKQVLLSELQHRVKNNLQHVISVLEMQKESIDFNNIEELIRGNQNRVHTMALLHKKLNVVDNVNEVDLDVYIKDLAELVCDSYSNTKMQIGLNIYCNVGEVPIEKALPLGLITAELVSNSMKHAFSKKVRGLIQIEIKYVGEELVFTYSDNGVGFEYDKVQSKGLGVEIIRGLIDQLDGVYVTTGNDGFFLQASIPNVM